MTLDAESTVGSNPQGPRHMQLTAPDVHPVRRPPFPPFLSSPRIVSRQLHAQVHAVISYAASLVSIHAHGIAAAAAAAAYCLAATVSS